jgi:hypothetical protein
MRPIDIYHIFRHIISNAREGTALYIPLFAQRVRALCTQIVCVFVCVFCVWGESEWERGGEGLGLGDKI